MASWMAAAPALLLSVSMIPALSAGVSAQGSASAEPAAPVFTQPVPNVFRRFAVDLAKMKEFYGDVLGLKPLPTLNMPGGGQMTRFHAGASEIKLQASAAESQAPTGGVRDVTGLRVLTFFFPDEAALTARFKEHGLPAPEFRNRTTSAGTTRAAMVRDPSNQWVEAVVVPGAPAEAYDRLEIGLTVADVETSRAFYRGFVGLEELKPVEDALIGATKYPFRMGTTTINVWSGPGDCGSTRTGPCLWCRAVRARTPTLAIAYCVAVRRAFRPGCSRPPLSCCRSHHSAWAPPHQPMTT